MLKTDHGSVSFGIYKTNNWFYIVCRKSSQNEYTILKLFWCPKRGLQMQEGQTVYNTAQKNSILDSLASGNAVTGGLTHIADARAILGLMRFTAGYYLYVCVEASAIAIIGGHHVFHVEKTELIPLTLHATTVSNEEKWFMTCIQRLDLSKAFYFSYTYDLTQTTQYNFTHPRLQNGVREMFMWNRHILKPLTAIFGFDSPWCIPIIHGFVDQAKLISCGKLILVTLIARRSRHFAGARYLKRGLEENGFVANEVETEQIVSDGSVSSFPSDVKTNGYPGYTSYVQHRGSIPLYWSQDFNNMTPKPPIDITLRDPFYSVTALHFDRLLGQYGSPCIVLNLIKAKEKIRREGILLDEYERAIAYLNQFLPEDKKIQYLAWDMSNAVKRNQPVIKVLERMADYIIKQTKFFSTATSFEPASFQEGIVRVNCIDCLDRTNAAQFIIGKTVFGHQLYKLGVISSPKLFYDSNAVRLLTEMYHNHGDAIALQYGGSLLVNTLQTYQRNNQWSSTSRDLIESIKRFYSNTFVDVQRQEAIDLFLGNFTTQGKNFSVGSVPRECVSKRFHDGLVVRRNYQHWWTPLYINMHFRLRRWSLEYAENSKHASSSRSYDELYMSSKFTGLHELLLFNMYSNLYIAPSSFFPMLTSTILPLSTFNTTVNEHGLNPFLRRRKPAEQAVISQPYKRDRQKRSGKKNGGRGHRRGYSSASNYTHRSRKSTHMWESIDIKKEDLDKYELFVEFKNSASEKLSSKSKSEHSTDEMVSLVQKDLSELVVSDARVLDYKAYFETEKRLSEAKRSTDIAPAETIAFYSFWLTNYK
ncbi:inositol polyphosphate phosphatase [Schizosaccharomyces japonicus yFS275]|uniref:Inositol polyphosphate phosphatase n=1 Tax=Schizosaccharomyces japonicus (strain yFS275 / FY16936) TaxID=402676 RepID=B6K225_SCHJY|nr:inositol polyphosphate phosphatase [Schizosaccharomyces japonicus yFS275]EEB07206.1 inositol polyphosphate phosphatase [Schizosaccharomyces japonicus yFS275]